MSLRIVPITTRQAAAFIEAWHRHHAPPRGYKYALGVAAGDLLVGVATAGRPVARHYDDGLTIEVTRVATDGTPHACSALYGACWRAAKAMGYGRAITYTHAATDGPACDGPCVHESCRLIRVSETGISLRAAGWLEGETRRPRAGWNGPARLRDNSQYVTAARRLWFVESGVAQPLPTRTSVAPSQPDEPDLFSAAGVAA